jgi:uncharacterized protein (TIGR03663 family)
MKPASTAKQARRVQASRSATAAGQRPQAASPGLRRFAAWHWTGAGILAGAAALRLILLSVKPLHHDEGVNGLFLTNLIRGGYYHYDPSNFHGPTLYYFGCVTVAINSLFFGKNGLSTFAIRLVPALFGIGIVWLLLTLRRELGNAGSLGAAALAATSSGFVYFSRYFIHEILFVFFTLAVIVTVLRYRQIGHTRYLMLATLSLAFLGATKETWVITVGVWLIALPCTWLYLRLRKTVPDEPAERTAWRERKPVAPSRQAPASEAEHTTASLYGTAALLFVIVWILLYSTFFTNFPQGVYDSFRTFGYWFKTSESAHTYGPTQYLAWIWQQDGPVLVLGSLGIALALGKARSRFLVFCAFWSLGILAAYSLIGYKTPWCVLNILLPFALMAGYSLEQLYQSMRTGSQGGMATTVTFFVAAIAVGLSLQRAIDISFFHYDDDTRAYVYAHTRRDFLSLVNEIESITAANPGGKDTGIVVMSPEHWSLPWYLRNYAHTAYSGKVIDTSEPLLVVHENQVVEVETKLGSRYRRYSSHDLRPGNVLYLYVRR